MKAQAQPAHTTALTSALAPAQPPRPHQVLLSEELKAAGIAVVLLQTEAGLNMDGPCLPPPSMSTTTARRPNQGPTRPAPAARKFPWRVRIPEAAPLSAHLACAGRTLKRRTLCQH